MLKKQSYVYNRFRNHIYLQADKNEQIIMLSCGKVVELIVCANPILYQPYITYLLKEVPILCVRLSKALYGIPRDALLFYKRRRKDLETMGFEINPYNPCVANMIINGA